MPFYTKKLNPITGIWEDEVLEQSPEETSVPLEEKTEEPTLPNTPENNQFEQQLLENYRQIVNQPLPKTDLSGLLNKYKEIKKQDELSQVKFNENKGIANIANTILNAGQSAARAFGTPVSNVDVTQGLVAPEKTDISDLALEQTIAKTKREESEEERKRKLDALKVGFEIAKLKSKDISKPTLSEKEYDKKTMGRISEWEKNRPIALKNLELLKTAKAELDAYSKKHTIQPTGSIVGLLPDVRQEPIDIRNKVHGAVIATLRPTLGAQFTQKEGERVLGYTYGDRVSPQENSKSIGRTIQMLENEMKFNDQAKQYFKQHKTMSGFELPINVENELPKKETFQFEGREFEVGKKYRLNGKTITFDTSGNIQEE